MKYFCFLLCIFSLFAYADNIEVNNVNFAYQIPSKGQPKDILVLFGGRNWLGAKTLKIFNFKKLAEKHNLILISPSFVNKNYWEPQTWSGNTLKTALKLICKKYKLHNPKIYLYGYSAGGQCAALFSDWMPEQITAWGAHGCGVYPEKIKNIKSPALITCGIDDTQRLQISRLFVYKYREAGGLVMWKYFNSGHGLNPKALELAKLWFDAIMSNSKIICFGEDDTMQIKKNIDTEFKNPIYNEKLMRLWQK